VGPGLLEGPLIQACERSDMPCQTPRESKCVDRRHKEIIRIIQVSVLSVLSVLVEELSRDQSEPVAVRFDIGQPPAAADAFEQLCYAFT
jgi:hypothetical protein